MKQTTTKNLFLKIRKNAMAVSFFKYGAVKQNYDLGKEMTYTEYLYNRINEYIETQHITQFNKKGIDCIGSMKKRLNKFNEDPNIEYLADVANFAMIEFMYPSVTNKTHYVKKNSLTDIDILTKLAKHPQIVSNHNNDNFDKTVRDILITEYSLNFDKLCEAQLIEGNLFYERLFNQEVKKSISDIINALIQNYLKNGNPSTLLTISNVCLIEFLNPSTDNAYLKNTDSDNSPGIVHMN